MSGIDLVLAAIEIPFMAVLYRLIGLALLSMFVAGAFSFVFRWRTRSQLPEGPALLLGLGAVTLYLNTNIILVQFLGAEGEVLTSNAVVVNLLIFAASTVTAAAGWQLGDRLGQSDRFRPTFEPRLSPLVRATGRTITVELPDNIEDIDGYEAVSKTQKEGLAEESYTFPRRMTVEALSSEIATRIRTDYDIAHVDIELTVEGEISYLAVGGRATGIGPTLPPEMTATAITADPAFSAGPGDTVQIWNGDKRVGTAELRGIAGQTVTVAGRETLIRQLEPDTTYRLMTFPAEERVDRLLAGMLRRSAETMSTIEVSEGSTLDGMCIDELGVPVIAVKAIDGSTETVPNPTRQIAAGETISVVAHPTVLRRIESAATGAGKYEPPDGIQSAPKKTQRFARLRRLR